MFSKTFKSVGQIKFIILSGLFAFIVLGLPAQIDAQDTPSGTGKTIAAADPVSHSGTHDQSAETIVTDESSGDGADDEDEQSSSGDPEWRYVPVRRTN